MASCEMILIEAPDELTFTLDAPAMGKPRMTQRDKWKQRPCVMAYRAWCDQLREACPNPPPAERVEAVTVIAHYAMPASWPQKKRAKLNGTKKRGKPDGDNVFKGIADALWKDDEKLGDQAVQRRWATHDLTIVRIRTA